MFAKSTLSLLLAGAACVGIPASVAGAAGAPKSAAERVGTTLDACHADPAPGARYAKFSAQMAQLKKGRSMAVRFDLYQRSPGDAGFHAVAASAPGFGVWQSSAPGVAILRYSQVVANLPAPASFRVLATYRWLNARKRTIRRAHRTSAVCVLPDERPNLVAGAITTRTGPNKSSSTYDVVVRNDGLGSAGPFAVSLSVAGQVLPPIAVNALAPAARQLLSFVGPKCMPGEFLSAVVDPAGAIDESTKADNTRSQTC